MIPPETIDLFLQENDCVCRLRKKKLTTESVELYSRRNLTERVKNRRRHFSSNTNRPLADKCMGYIVNKDSGKGGVQDRAGAMAGSLVNNFEHIQVSHVTCDWPMSSWVVVTWGHLHRKQTDWQTREKTLPSYKLAVKIKSIHRLERNTRQAVKYCMFPGYWQQLFQWWINMKP